MKARVISSSLNEDGLVEEMQKVKVSPEGLSIMKDKGIFRVVKMSNVPLKAALILKQEMLAKGGEVVLNREVASLKAETSDLLVMGTEMMIEVVSQKLKDQPFGLDKLSKELVQAIHNYESVPQDLVVGNRKLSFAKMTHIMGILNVTPDSFSDGGRYYDCEKACDRAVEMASQGATIIDIGGESSRPNSEGVTVEEELKRILPVVESILHESCAMISIDTTKAEVAKRAIELGAHIINDISGMTRDSDMASVIADSDACVVLMHMRGTPDIMQGLTDYGDVVGEVYEYLAERIEYAISKGISRERIIVDPGIGFAKTVEQNLEIMRRLDEFRSLGRPILIGTSRKATIGHVLNASVSERLLGTAATVAQAVAGGANIVRVHDVKEMEMVTRMSDAIVRKHWQEKEG